MILTTALEEALNEAISSGRFIDTKVVLFSRRDSSGRICNPKALYANSLVLKSVPYFRDLLFGKFAEAEVKDVSEPCGDEFAEDYGYSSDSDLEEDSDFEGHEAAATPVMSSPIRADRRAPLGEYQENIKTGKVIKVQDIAFITFQAFLFYLYTDWIDFAPFGSEENRKSRSSEILDSTRWASVPKPSPKSIYRLADKYDIPDLKRLALNRIQNTIRDCDIVRETFSVFTSRYEEVRSIQVIHLSSVWLSGNQNESKALHKKLDEVIDSYAAGRLEHAAEAIYSLWKLTRITRPLSSILKIQEEPEVDVVIERTDMRSQLIWSMQGGSFLQREYWARQSRGGSVGPIYLPDPGWSSKFPRVDIQCHETASDYLGEDEEYEFSEDDDSESGGDGDGDQISSDVEICDEREQKTLPVLKIGPLVAWRSLFSYLCTGKIQFAPLRSQGLVYRSQWKLENTKLGSPVPCSPKTIFVLAAKLKITSLIDLAFENIKAKTTKENAIAETFSKFASQHSEFVAMGWKYLDARMGKKEINESVREIIYGMAGGQAAYQADALKFGLYRALRQMGTGNCSLPRLRCTSTACEAHRKPVSSFCLGNSIKCTKRGDPFGTVCNLTMKCSGCGRVRTDHCTWCKGCRSMFG